MNWLDIPQWIGNLLSGVTSTGGGTPPPGLIDVVVIYEPYKSLVWQQNPNPLIVNPNQVKNPFTGYPNR